jgi:hypothetical protein
MERIWLENIVDIRSGVRLTKQIKNLGSDHLLDQQMVIMGLQTLFRNKYSLDSNLLGDKL